MGKVSRLIPFKKSKAGKPTPEVVFERGTIGESPTLSWEVYSYGTIHIFDDTGLRFKKDCDKFEEELDKIPSMMKPGDKHVIKASGDNDDLVVTNNGGEYKLSLTRKGLAVVGKLRELVGKAKSLNKK